MIADHEQLNAETAHLIWVLLALAFLVLVVLPFLYQRRKR